MTNQNEMPARIIARTYSELLPGKFARPEATALLLAIGYQESRFKHRQQVGGPARSFWQFERGGGVAGVLRHPATSRHARAVCALRDVSPTSLGVYNAMLTDDLLGCAFARLLLFSDPLPLPSIGAIGASWDYYIRNWRPGKPHRLTWDLLYATALQRQQEMGDESNQVV
jgi:hypothetical protein